LALSGRILFPVYDPDPGRRTFDVYAVSLDNGERERVPEQASQPALSPDGKRLAYRSWDREYRGIWVLELSEGNHWLVTGIVQAARPSWSPDSQAIVVASDHVPGDAPRLYRSVGQDLIQIERTARTGSAESYAETPAWLGDDRIIHSACSPEGCGLYIMDGNGSGLRRLTQGEHDTAPAPSPDGSQIAFMSDQDGNWEIYVVGTDSGGQKPKRLTNDSARDGLPAWLPDGQWLAFVTNRGGRWSVWAMRPDGSDVQKLFELGGPLEGKIAFVPDDQQQGWTWETIVWLP
jgi:TolB protein